MANGEYGLIVIGSGSAGLTGACFVAQLDLKVVLAEKNRVRADCTWTGCVPSKSLLMAAKISMTCGMLTASESRLRNRKSILRW